MPKVWLYYTALLLPLVFGMLVAYSPLVDWLWYNHYPQAYHVFNVMRAEPKFLELLAGWTLPVFVMYVLARWHTAEDEEEIAHRFLLLPLVYTLFAIIGNVLITRAFDPSALYSYPLVILPCGYFYVLSWEISVWVFKKLRIVM